MMAKHAVVVFVAVDLLARSAHSWAAFDVSGSVFVHRSYKLR